MASVKNRVFVNKNKGLMTDLISILTRATPSSTMSSFLAAPRERSRMRPSNEGTAVIYFDDDGFAIFQVGDANDGAEGQFAVCGG